MENAESTVSPVSPIGMTKRIDVARLMFWVSAGVLLFALGFVISAFRVFPYSLIRDGVHAVRQVLSERETLAGIRPMELTQPARSVGSGLTINKPGTQPGLTFVASFFAGGDNELRLMRLDGSVVHRWPVRFFDVFPPSDQGHIDLANRPQREWQVHTHGALVLPDGSVVFNFEGFGTAKLDRCGGVVWRLPLRTHHSIDPSGDGGFWIPGGTMVRSESPFPLLRPPYSSESILKVSADGKVVDEISVLDVLFANGLGPYLFANGMPGVRLVVSDGFGGADLTHLNDVEELTPALARGFPQFRAGDLLLSLRNLNMVVVLDPASRKVKWHQTGPWIKQHDPDFVAGGRISVFNNNDDGTPTGSISGGSQIVEIDPASRRTAIRYGGTPEQHWFSFRRGKQQYLPNGNVLITDSESGRIIEVTQKGDVVWEYVNRYDEKYVAVIRDALRYPESYFTVENWTCDAK